MATARLDIRLDEHIKAKAEKASTLLGLKSLTEYIVRLMDEDATLVIAQHEGVVVDYDLFDQFMAACEQAQAPNAALKDALAVAKARGFA